MLADATFGERIDKNRIGAAGSSLGGYTMIALAGGITDRAAFTAFCASRVITVYVVFLRLFNQWLVLWPPGAIAIVGKSVEFWINAVKKGKEHASTCVVDG